MIDKLINMARNLKASDLHLTLGEPPAVRVNGEIARIESMPPLRVSDLKMLSMELVQKNKLVYNENKLDYDFCYVSPDGLRQRVNIFTQNSARGLVLRMLNSKVPDIEDLKLPAIFKSIAMLPRGLVLVTGPTGSGKTTTLAAMVDFINNNKKEHILTIEDPVEYMHDNKKCIVNQREIGVDVEDFAAALRSALREDPDIILVGEMRDLETISAAITAAETGHMVMGTLHTIGAAKTIDRLIDAFSAHQQQQVRVQLSTALQAVITQTLMRTKDEKGRVAAFEIMIVNDAIANLIREGKTYQIKSVMQTNVKYGMVLLDMFLGDLVRRDIITMESAIDRCTNPEELRRFSAQN